MYKRLLVVMLVVLVLLAGCTIAKPTSESKLVLHVIDVGQGDSVLLQAGESVVLIDAGERNKGTTVVDYLNKQNVKQIDLFIGTHPHSDHIGGAVEVFKNFEVKRIIDSGKPHTSQTYIDYLRYIDENDLDFEVAANQVIKLSPSVVLEIIGPVRDYTSLNDSSVVAKVTVGTQAVLLTGDMEQTAERDLIAKADLKADILKVGHHGSKTSTSPEFLSAIKPKVALISVGQGNSYSHPASETLERLMSERVAIYRSDIHGAIVVSLDGSKYLVTTEKGSGK